MKKTTLFFILVIIITLTPFYLRAQFSEANTKLLQSTLGKHVNDLRESKGVKALLFDKTLEKAALFHCKYMVQHNVLTHLEKEEKYATPKKRVIEQGGNDFEIVGENVLYTSPKKFPMGEKEILAIAEEMFLSWKNSPRHYANMIDPEYIYGDFGFEIEKNKGVVYATQVFGKKGIRVPNQLSKNTFGIAEVGAGCDKKFERFSNLVANMGNALRIEDGVVKLYYHNIEYFDLMFENKNDGIAVDIVSRDQLLCNKSNQLDMSPIYDGVMLKPVYKEDFKRNNQAKGDYRIITTVGQLPERFLNDKISLSVILINEGKYCQYRVPSYAPRKAYELKIIQPIVKDVEQIVLSANGVIGSQEIKYEFNVGQSKPSKFPLVLNYPDSIHSIDINTFTSVDGDSAKNELLHQLRAQTIQHHLKKDLLVPDSLFKIAACENWELMKFQLHYHYQEKIAALPQQETKTIISSQKQLLPWANLLHQQRTSTAIIHYWGELRHLEDTASMIELNLRTAAITNNTALANKALATMYAIGYFNTDILFEESIFKFFNNNSDVVTNFSAVLSHVYEQDIQKSTAYLFNWINKSPKLDQDSKHNLLHLYTLIGNYLLDDWDVSAERLSNVVHPNKVNILAKDMKNNELMLNLQLTYIQYFGQINDGDNISKSFNFISNYFKRNSLSPEDDVDLVLFFNNWSMYEMTNSYLLSKLEENKLNEDGLFALAQTLNLYSSNIKPELYLTIQQQAVKMNKTRWCLWLEQDFQILRNHEIKRIYCEHCN